MDESRHGRVIRRSLESIWKVGIFAKNQAMNWKPKKFVFYGVQFSDECCILATGIPTYVQLLMQRKASQLNCKIIPGMAVASCNVQLPVLVSWWRWICPSELESFACPGWWSGRSRGRRVSQTWCGPTQCWATGSLSAGFPSFHMRPELRLPPRRRPGGRGSWKARLPEVGEMLQSAAAVVVPAVRDCQMKSAMWCSFERELKQKKTKPRVQINQIKRWNVI